MANNEGPVAIAPGVAYLTTGISNVYFVGDSAGWILVDAGVVGYTRPILAAATARFGVGSKPQAIILTHGHYDHVGCARDLHSEWRCPVFAHPLEMPYLTGKSDYPQKDPTVGGAMGFLSRFFPSRSVDLSAIVEEMPSDGSVPGLSGWTAIHTPGHSPGQISLWRESDRVLLAGDAMATADLDSWRGIATQRPQLSRPPSPFTYDWLFASDSIRRLAELEPAVIACGHGLPITGPNTAALLRQFADAVRPPSRGRYVGTPAKADKYGVVYEPPAPPDRLPKIAAGIVAGTFLVAGALYRKRGAKAKLDFVPGGKRID